MIWSETHLPIYKEETSFGNNLQQWAPKKLHIEFIFWLGKLQGHQVGELSFSDLQEGECASNLPFLPFPFFPTLFLTLLPELFFGTRIGPSRAHWFPPPPLFLFFVDRVSSFVFPFFFPDFPIPPPPSLLLLADRRHRQFPTSLREKGETSQVSSWKCLVPTFLFPNFQIILAFEKFFSPCA